MENLESDMQLLLDALNYMKDDKSLQMQALRTLAKMCEDKNGATYLYKHGGLKSITNIFCNTKCLQIKQLAIYALSNAVQYHEPSKVLLCIPEMMKSIHAILSAKEGTMVHLAGNFLLCLAKDYAPAKVLARTENCLQRLLDIYRSTTPRSDVWFDEIGQHTKNLWVIVSSALCSLMSDPQNEKNQVMCAKALPQAISVMKNARKDVIFTALNFIGHCICDNSETQRTFKLLGGMNSLVLIIESFTDASDDEDAALLSIALKTLSCSFSDFADKDCQLESTSLLKLLLGILQRDDMSLQVISSCLVCLSRCIDNSESNKEALIKYDGISVLVSILVYAQDDEIRKIVLFLLQTCSPLNKGEAIILDKKLTTVALEGKPKDLEISNVTKRSLNVQELSSRNFPVSSNLNLDNDTLNTNVRCNQSSRYSLEQAYHVDANPQKRKRVSSKMIRDACSNRYQEKKKVSPLKELQVTEDQLTEKHHNADNTSLRISTKQLQSNNEDLKNRLHQQNYLHHKGSKDDRVEQHFRDNLHQAPHCQSRKHDSRNFTGGNLQSYLPSHAVNDLGNERVLRTLEWHSKLLTDVNRRINNLSFCAKSDSLRNTPLSHAAKISNDNVNAGQSIRSESISSSPTYHSSSLRPGDDISFREENKENQDDSQPSNLKQNISLENGNDSRKFTPKNRSDYTKTRREHHIATMSSRKYPSCIQDICPVSLNKQGRLSSTNGKHRRGYAAMKLIKRDTRSSRKSEEDKKHLYPQQIIKDVREHSDVEHSFCLNQRNHLDAIKMPSHQTPLSVFLNARGLKQEAKFAPGDTVQSNLVSDTIAITITPGMKRKVQQVNISKNESKPISISKRFSFISSQKRENEVDLGYEAARKNVSENIHECIKKESPYKLQSNTSGVFSNGLTIENAKNRKKPLSQECYKASEWIKNQCKNYENTNTSHNYCETLNKTSQVSRPPSSTMCSMEKNDLSPTGQLSPQCTTGNSEDPSTGQSMKTPLNYLSTRLAGCWYKAKRMLMFNEESSLEDGRSVAKVDDHAIECDEEVSSNHSSRSSHERAASPSILPKDPSDHAISQNAPEKEQTDKCLACYPFSRFPFFVLNSRNCTTILQKDENTCDFHRTLLVKKAKCESEASSSDTYCESAEQPKNTEDDSTSLKDGNLLSKDCRGTSLFDYTTSPSAATVEKDCSSLPHGTSVNAVSKKTVTSIRRKRQDYGSEEIEYIFKGIKRYGKRWNAILNSYDFKKGRTASDLKDKYKQLNKKSSKGLKRGGKRNGGNKLKPFTAEEMVNLKIGIGRYGRRWKTILNSFKFQQGRTANELQFKYERVLSRF